MTVPAMFDLSGRVALVAGGTKGIGKSFARQYVDHGGRVIIAARDSGMCAAVADELNEGAADPVAWPQAFDLDDVESIDMLIEKAGQRWGKLDTVFGASFFGAGGTAAATDDEMFAKILRLNIVHYSRLAHRALDLLKQSDLASVIFVGSASGVRPQPNIAAYGIAKLGLMRLGQNLAIEWGPLGVRVNILTPGMTRTPAVMRWLPEDDVARRVADFPIRRMADPDEIAAAGIFLASRAAGYMTGHELICDGGRTLLSGNTGPAFQRPD
ncbi:SDR family NAD(P)-dependent oxidoreductase [Sphingobium wenxiniae]|uniref:NAD(P)-dependent dehydrogenase (Short-subunit alcohol dehydrogenase family) n=2 Tax=Sphingobium TaxID=165695 RepID=A0A562K2B5_SPHWJ|nr:SDR family oxidoreductase [Sphingobium wenxiniae]TWH89355.1 NAD(P)-dependent dehydrogenase (short-subunit alcohol dehydrogenase family) [Sphingobium wenxiniae]